MHYVIIKTASHPKSETDATYSNIVDSINCCSKETKEEEYTHFH